MSGDPKLGTMTKMQLAAFAGELALKYPDHRRSIFSLQDTLEGKLDQNPQLQNEIIRKLNANTNGTLANARAVIEKDPKILEQVNKDPTKLASLMGIKMPAPAQAAPAKAEPAPAKAEPIKVVTATPKADTPKTDTPKADAPKTAPAANPAATNPAPVKPEAAAVAAAPLSDQELAQRAEIAQESLKVTKMEGYDTLAKRAANSQSLSQAIDAMMGGKAATPQEQIKTLKELQKDPQFFVKANAFIDSVPEQSREMAFTEAANNPDLAKRAISGDKQAESELQNKVMMNGLFGGGADGKGGLGNLFGGDMMKGLGEMLQKIIPAFMEMFKAVMGKLVGGLEKMGGSQGLMRMGNNPEGTGALTQKLGQVFGMDAGNIPVVDASKPGEPTVPAAQLAAKQPALSPQGPEQRPEQRPAIAVPGTA